MAERDPRYFKVYQDGDDRELERKVQQIVESGAAPGIDMQARESIDEIQRKIDSGEIGGGGGGSGIDPKAREDIQQVTAQLAENAFEVTKNSNPTKKKGLISIIFDDGWLEDYEILKPIADSYGIKCCTAMVTSYVGKEGYMNKNQLLDLQNNSGWEIMSHTYNHVDMGLDDVDFTKELVQSKTELEAMGLNIKGIVYPWEHYNDKTLEVVRETYRYACGISSVRTGLTGLENDLYGHVLNDSPINQYALYRLGLASSVEKTKLFIDKAVETGSWLILCSHGFSFNPGKESKAQENVNNFTAICQYLSDNYADNVVTCNEAMETKENLITYGDRSGDFYFVSKEGNIDTNMKNFSNVVYEGNKADVNTSPDYFRNNAITINSYMTADAAKGFPGAKGILKTHKFDSRAQNSELAYQEWKNLNEPNKIYTRYRTSGAISGWSDWTINDLSIWKRTTDTMDVNRVIGDYETAKIQVQYGTAEGFPTSRGVLETYKMGSSNNYAFQLWYSDVDDTVWFRRCNNPTTWKAWVQLNSGSIVSFKENNEITNETLPSAIEDRKITWSTYGSADVNGFPKSTSSAGNLLTLKNDKKSTALGLQMWYPIRDRNFYIRRYDNGWKPWNAISFIKAARLSGIQVPLIPANGTSYVDIPVSDITLNSSINVTCSQNAIDVINVMYQGVCPTDGTLRIVFRNFTNADIPAKNVYFEIMYSYSV